MKNLASRAILHDPVWGAAITANLIEAVLLREFGTGDVLSIVAAPVNRCKTEGYGS